jgi:hypothetical protein
MLKGKFLSIILNKLTKIILENLEVIKGLDKQNKLEEKNLDLLKNYVNNILNFNLVKLNK